TVQAVQSCTFAEVHFTSHCEQRELIVVHGLSALHVAHFSFASPCAKHAHTLSRYCFEAVLTVHTALHTSDHVQFHEFHCLFSGRKVANSRGPNSIPPPHFFRSIKKTLKDTPSANKETAPSQCCFGPSSRPKRELAAKGGILE
ncbi:unnamed protein product, partial [Sphacelaria rigidula]